MMQQVFRLIVLSLLVTVPAHAETIDRLGDNASCRDKNGAVRQPLARPSPRAEVTRAPQGMIKTVRDVAGAACFFYSTEVALAETSRECEGAETGGPRKNTSGTVSNLEGSQSA